MIQLVPLKYHPHMAPHPTQNPTTSNILILNLPLTIDIPHLKHLILIQNSSYAQQTITPITPNTAATSRHPFVMIAVLLPKIMTMQTSNTIEQYTIIVI